MAAIGAGPLASVRSVRNREPVAEAPRLLARNSLRGVSTLVRHRVPWRHPVLIAPIARRCKRNEGGSTRMAMHKRGAGDSGGPEEPLRRVPDEVGEGEAVPARADPQTLDEGARKTQRDPARNGWGGAGRILDSLALPELGLEAGEGDVFGIEGDGRITESAPRRRTTSRVSPRRLWTTPLHVASSRGPRPPGASRRRARAGRGAVAARATASSSGSSPRRLGAPADSAAPPG
jgi:hypothetical protein